MISTITMKSLLMGTVASGYLFDAFNGFGSADIKVTVKEKGAYHGADLSNFSYGKRGFSLEGRIVGDTLADYSSKRRALQKAFDIFDGLDTITIVTKDGLTLEMEAIANGNIDTPYKAGNAIMSEFRIELVAPYPFIEGSVENTETVAVHTGGGAEIPAEMPMEIGEGGVGDTTITNDGNGKAYPVIKIYGAIENPSITNTTRGEGLSITYTLATSTDYIEIDTYLKTVLLNGVTNIKQYVTGDFWVLDSGDNVIRLTGSSSSGAQAEVIYKDSYLGI